VNDALVLADQDGASLDLPRPPRARLDERVEQAAGRRAQAAERLFLQLMADSPRQEVLRGVAGVGGFELLDEETRDPGSTRPTPSQLNSCDLGARPRLRAP
jgi:hypothetical protein